MANEPNYSSNPSKDEPKKEKVRVIPLEYIDEFPGHPFKVLDDESMQKLMNSIEEIGVQSPIVARIKEDQRYEIISGHRRVHACRRLGLKLIPAIVRDLSRDEAIIAMVDANLQREHILPSEKAAAYKMKMDAMKRRAGRPSKNNSTPMAGNFKGTETADIVGAESGDSGDQVRRYIRLNELVPELLEMVDRESIAFRPAVELSYGMSPEIKLRDHQADAVARILYGGNTLLAHVVGAGKTFTMVAAAQESKRLGLCSKSMFVVPNHLINQWASEYLQLYPSANILVATKKDFETKNRKKFCARIATGDYDAIIIGHSQFEKIPMSSERQAMMLQNEIDELMDSISELKESRGERFTIKQLEKTKKQLQLKLDKLNDRSRKDDVVTFEQLGVDRLFVDEAHFYKNLAAYTKMRNVAGISQTEAQKSSDLYMKCRYLDEITGGKGVTFATGTPISNTMVELYTMQKYLQYDALKEKGLTNFDAWASTFGETVIAIELDPTGTGYRAKTRFAKFFNIPELMAMFKEVADVQTADMLNLPVPRANFHVEKEPSSEIQKEMVQSFADRAAKVHSHMVSSDEDNMLLITNDGRKAALDQRLLNPDLPDFEESKVNHCVRNVVDIWKRTAEQKSAQLVFCDLSTPHHDGKFNVYDDIRKKLIEEGIPESEIAFIHDADTDAKKKDLFSKVRSGQVRVLMGSTFKMGAGTNVQERLIALHDLDVPWRPSDLEQRLGRIVRQGNSNPEVEIYRYVTEGTFDAYVRPDRA